MDAGTIFRPGQSPFFNLLFKLRARCSAAGALILALAIALIALPAPAETIVSCGFEPNGDTWKYTSSGGAINTSDGTDDSPAGQRILGGSQSWLVSKTTSTLIFSEVMLSGWKDVSVNYRVSSTALGGGSGNAAFDLVAGYVATTSYADQKKPVFGNTASTTLTGNGAGATWGYDSAASFVRIGVSNGKRSLALKIHATNDDAKKCWNIDNVAIEGTRTVSHDVWWNGAGASNPWNNLSDNKCWTSEIGGGNYYAWNGANSDNAYFGQSGGGVTIGQGTTVAARSLIFATDGYTIAPGDMTSKLALTNGGSGGAGENAIEVTDANHTATISATIIANPGVGLTKTGEGTLVLGGANTFSGMTSVRQGTLCLTSNAALVGSAGIDLAADATLDVSAIAGGYRLGASGSQTLSGNGRILGSLTIDGGGVHNLGNSPGLQYVQGNYTMKGLLETEISGPAPGNGVVGYDQVFVTGETSCNVLLEGALSLAWSGTGWASADDSLWIIRNDTDGSLSGTFLGHADGSVVGDYDGRSWRIYYGADANTGQFLGGNDVLLTSASPVPEPGALGLAMVGFATMGLVGRRRVVSSLWRKKAAT